MTPLPPAWRTLADAPTGREGVTREREREKVDNQASNLTNSPTHMGRRFSSVNTG
ncbi:hypothetical protein [Nitrosomonas sp.]|uniref:hypothetical protein n=1 Tax=Nitrosomonas sp. TaxID=42353 RepID=UPI0032EDEB5E